jgi:hypothetical protein
MLLVVLVFLDNTLQILGLTVLSQMADRLVFYLPNLGVVALIVGIGLFLANLVADRAEDLLDQEGIGRARLTGQLVSGAFRGGTHCSARRGSEHRGGSRRRRSPDDLRRVEMTRGDAGSTVRSTPWPTPHP